MEKKFTVHFKLDGTLREQEVTIVCSNVNTSAKYLNLTSTNEGIDTMEKLFQEFLSKENISSEVYQQCNSFMVYLANSVTDFKYCGVHEMRFIKVYKSDFIYGFGISGYSNKNIILCILSL